MIFWSNKARGYPSPFASRTIAKTRRILRILDDIGADFRGKAVLDIGCGAGAYALNLAAKAGQVLGIDSSPAMLKIFRAERRRRGIGNAACLKAAWADVPEAKVKGKFDIALASMTMAIKTSADLLKMERAARELCVYIGWAGVRRNALLEKVYAAHGLEYGAPRGAGNTLKLLRALGRRPKAVYIDDSWTKATSVEETLRDLAVSMKVNGARFKKEWTASFIKSLARRGKVRQLTRLRKAVITWRPPAGPARR